MHQLHCKEVIGIFLQFRWFTVLAAPQAGAIREDISFSSFFFELFPKHIIGRSGYQNSKAGPWGIPSHDSCMRSCLRKYPWVVQSWLVLVSREYLLNTNTEELDSIHIKVTESVSPSIICIAMNWRYYISLFTCYF